MKTRIHVNQHNIRANRNGECKPVITAKDYKSNRIGNTALIKDAKGNVVAKVVYQPDKPMSCGAVCWVETELEVEVK